MSPFLQLAVSLVIILLAAKCAGYIAQRLHQPSVFGELLIGVLLGPSLFNLTGWQFITDTHLGEIIHELGEMGVLLLMFLAGMELHINDLRGNTRVSILAGSFGVLVPVVLGIGVGFMIGLQSEAAIFLGLSLGATSVSISAQTLIELRVLRSRLGLGLLSAAVFDDVLVILLISLVLAIFSGGSGVTPVMIIFLKILLFLLLSVGFGIWVLPRLAHIIARLPISQSTLTFALVILLLYGVAAEVIGGMAAITGTFLAGLMFGRSPEKSRLESGMQVLGYSLFIPIFFVSIGLSIDLHTISTNILWMMGLVIVVAILGKMVGAGVGAKLAGFTNREALQLGIAMVSRGEVGLIVASVGLQQEVITPAVFSMVVGMVLVTTLFTPPFLRWALRSPRPTIKIPSEGEV